MIQQGAYAMGRFISDNNWNFSKVIGDMKGRNKERSQHFFLWWSYISAQKSITSDSLTLI
jgi:hypothetical protein